MTEKLNFKYALLLVMALVFSFSMTSCLGDDDDEDVVWVEEEASETHLCGVTWVLANIQDDDSDDTDDAEVAHEVYVFDLSGEGYHEFVEDGVIQTNNFTWKSYKYGTSHKLSMLIEGYESYGEFETLYAVENLVTLRIMAAGDDGAAVVKEFRAE